MTVITWKYTLILNLQGSSIFSVWDNLFHIENIKIIHKQGFSAVNPNFITACDICLVDSNWNKWCNLNLFILQHFILFVNCSASLYRFTHELVDLIYPFIIIIGKTEKLYLNFIHIWADFRYVCLCGRIKCCQT